MSLTFEYNGEEIPFVPANPNMNALRVMRAFESGEEVREGDWRYFVKSVNGVPFEEASFEMQWGSYVAGFDFLSVVMQNMRLRSSRQ